jgi:hypothetical protein
MRTPPPLKHPAPHQSALWPHWQFIGQARRSKKTWRLIAAELKDSYGITITAGTVRNFFKRASKGRLPLGVVSNTPAARPMVNAVRPTVLARAPKLSVEPEDDPFSVKIIEFDPWKPQNKTKAS